MKLDLGCSNIKKNGYVGIDSYDWSAKYGKDFVCGKIPEVLSVFENNSIDEVRASHFIEHIPQHNVIRTFNEIYRILIPNGIFEIYVPSTTGKGAFCDPTHVSFWNDMSFRYFDMTWNAELSKSYGIKCNFMQAKVELLTVDNLHAILKKREN